MSASEAKSAVATRSNLTVRIERKFEQVATTTFVFRPLQFSPFPAPGKVKRVSCGSRQHLACVTDKGDVYKV